MVVFMPFVWDLLPICTIFILHHSNFTNQNKDVIEERETLIRQFSETQDSQIRASDGAFMDR